MADLTHGFTFATGDTVNAADLEDLITEATIANVGRDDVDQDTVTVATLRDTAPPGPYVKEIWTHLTQLAPARYGGGASQIWYGALPIIIPVYVEVSDILYGMVIRPLESATGGAVPHIVRAVNTHLGAEIGVMVTSTSVGNHGLALVGGSCLVRVTGTVNRGELLRTSNTAGFAKAIAGEDASEIGVGGLRIFAQAITADSGGFCHAWLRR